MNKKALKNKLHGQGILEVVIAIGVIATGLIGTLSLAMANISSAHENEARVKAFNLAREAIEIVRNLRDSNWLAEREVWMGLKSASTYEGGVDYTAILVFDYQFQSWQLDFRPDVLGQPATELYSYNDLIAQPYEGGQTVSYYRLITLSPICQNGEIVKNDGQSCQTATNPQIGVKVKAAMLWYQHDQTKQVVLEEDLYNWR